MQVPDLSNGELEILLRDVHAAFAKRVHAGLRAHALNLCARRARKELGDAAQVDATREVHATRVDAQDVETRVLVGRRELDLAVDAPGPQQGRVQDVHSVRGHYHLNVLLGLEAVQLVEQLEHCALHLAVRYINP